MTAKSLFKIGIAATFMVSLVAGGTFVAAEQSSPSPARLLPLGGLVQFEPYGSDSWQNVGKAVGINVGDEIRTGNDGAATLSISTGITFKIYPNSFVQLQSVNIGSALRVTLSEFLGITLTTVDQSLKSVDSVQVVTPATVATVHGTAFFTFVSSQGSTAFVGQDHEVVVQNLSGVTVKNGADNATYYPMKAKPGQICTVDFLTQAGQGFTFTDLSQQAGFQKLRDFLTELFHSNVNPSLMSFLSSYLGLSSSATQQDILDKLGSFDKPGQLGDFLTAFRKYLTDYFAAMSTGNLAPDTCGNGKVESGKTPQNCGTDAGDFSQKGNRLCQTMKGESLINDPTDCFPVNTAVLNCSLVMLAGGFEQVAKHFSPPTPMPVPPTWTPWPSCVIHQECTSNMYGGQSCHMVC